EASGGKAANNGSREHPAPAALPSHKVSLRTYWSAGAEKKNEELWARAWSWRQDMRRRQQLPVVAIVGLRLCVFIRSAVPGCVGGRSFAVHLATGRPRLFLQTTPGTRATDKASPTPAPRLRWPRGGRSR